MTPAERLQAAIWKLEQLKSEAFPGPWEILTSGVEGGDHWYITADNEAILYVTANDGSDEELRAPTAALVTVLHRTIDAQLAILRFGVKRQEAVDWLSRINKPGPDLQQDAAALELALADAIIGDNA